MRQLLIFTFVIIGCLYAVHAQQDIQYTHYKYRLHALNPALAGTQDAIPTTIFSRNQWLGLDGAPIAQSIDIHTPLYGLGGGAGVIINNDKQGALRSTTLNFSLAKHLPLKNALLSLGISAGIVQKSLDGNDLRAPQGDYGEIFTHNDNILPLTKVNAIGPNVGFGVYLLHDKFFTSISITNLLESEILLDGVSESIGFILDRTVHFAGGYDFPVNDIIELQPSIYIKSDFAKTQSEFSIQAEYNEFVWVGAAYRGFGSNNNDAVAALGGIQLQDKFKIGLSYDFTTSDLNQVSNGSFEAFVQYLFHIDKPNRTPKTIYNPRHL